MQASKSGNNLSGEVLEEPTDTMLPYEMLHTPGTDQVTYDHDSATSTLGPGTLTLTAMSVDLTTNLTGASKSASHPAHRGTRPLVASDRDSATTLSGPSGGPSSDGGKELTLFSGKETAEKRPCTATGPATGSGVSNTQSATTCAYGKLDDTSVTGGTATGGTAARGSGSSRTMSSLEGTESWNAGIQRANFLLRNICLQTEQQVSERARRDSSLTWLQTMRDQATRTSALSIDSVEHSPSMLLATHTGVYGKKWLPPQGEVDGPQTGPEWLQRDRSCSCTDARGLRSRDHITAPTATTLSNRSHQTESLTRAGLLFGTREDLSSGTAESFGSRPPAAGQAGGTDTEGRSMERSLERMLSQVEAEYQQMHDAIFQESMPSFTNMMGWSPQQLVSTDAGADAVETKHEASRGAEERRDNQMLLRNVKQVVTGPKMEEKHSPCDNVSVSSSSSAPMHVKNKRTLLALCGILCGSLAALLVHIDFAKPVAMPLLLASIGCHMFQVPLAN